MGGEETAAIEGAARAYFDAFATGADTSPYSSGLLKQEADYIRQARAGFPEGADQKGRTDPAGVPFLTIEHLAVRSVQENRATLDLAARWVEPAIPRRRTVVAEFSGPLIMTREADGWRVTDVVVDGIPLLERYVEQRAEPVAAAGAVVTPLLVATASSHSRVYFEVEARESGLWMWECWATTSWKGPFAGRLHRGIALEPGERALVVAAAPPVQWRWTRSIRMLMPVFAGERWRYLRFAVQVKRER